MLDISAVDPIRVIFAPIGQDDRSSIRSRSASGRWSLARSAIMIASVVVTSSVSYVLCVGPARGQESSSALMHPGLGSAEPSRYSIGGPGDQFLIVDGISDRAFVNLSGKWPTDADKITRIPVCWVKPKQGHEEQRKLVESSVRGTWQLLSSIQFQNWSTCTPADTHAVKITVGDYWPSTSHAGVDTLGNPPTMNLNFDFEDPPQWRDCKLTSEACIRKVAVHEFGHALAFMHEQTRTDTPDTCLSRQKGEAKPFIDPPGFTTEGTPWDPESVMNYCNPVWNNAGNLSPNDVLALQRVYGTPRR